MRRMSPIVVSVAFAWVAFLAWVAYGYVSIRGVEEPAYTVLVQAEGYEIRNYPPHLLAQVAVDGPWSTALSRGFSLLADYIFGNNIASASIAMTAPVGIESEPEGERIAATAPVTSQEKGAQFLISFIMPSSYTRESLPRPNNPQIRIVEVPESVFAVKTFSGWVNDRRALDKEETLRSEVKRDGHLVTGAARVAQYNPPWTPPFMRRNEVLLPVRRP